MNFTYKCFAVRLEGLSYSKFINGLKKSNITINRKMLSELAINEPQVFSQLIAIARDSE